MAINQAVDRTAMTAAQAQLARDLADAVHLFCSLYGRHPGLIELALNNCPAGPVRDWLREASDAYERERLYLARVTASGGPLPSTPAAAPTGAARLRARRGIRADGRRAGDSRDARPRSRPGRNAAPRPPPA